MHYDENELELYHEFLLFVRRKTCDDYQLKFANLLDLEIEFVENKGDKYLFRFYYELKDKRKAALLVEAISYEKWKIMIERDKKLSQIL